MKLTCKQSDLAKGLSTVGHAVSSRSTLPILANILFTTDNGRLRLSATNLETGINCWIDADIQDEGQTTVPAKTFTDLVNSLAQGTVDLSVDDKHTINVKTAQSNANVKGMDPEEFPQIPGAEGGSDPLLFDAAQLKRIISMVQIAAADDDSRPIFTAVQLVVADKTTRLAAADSYRLALFVFPTPEMANLENDILIPAKTLAGLARILPSDGPVQMVVTRNHSQVLFHTSDVDMVSRLVEGTYPNVRGALPKQHATRVVVETKEFASAIKMVTPFARDNSNILRIKVAQNEEGQGTMTLEATAADVGDNTVTIAANIAGPDQQVIFSSRYLAEGLGAIDTPEVALELNNAGSPGVMRPIGGGDYTYVIMPMSVNK
jgi:DNA polymerase-3 subunit beta